MSSSQQRTPLKDPAPHRNNRFQGDHDESLNSYIAPETADNVNEVAFKSWSLDEEALRAADAIDSLLKDAMEARSQAITRYKKANFEKETYEHAQMYHKLHNLPKEKVQMYAQVCKLREQLSQTQEQASKAASLFASERKQLRESKLELLQQLEETKTEINRRERRIGELETALSHKEQGIKDNEKLLQDKIQHEISLRKRLESELRRAIEQQRLDFEKQIAALKAKADNLEVMADFYRGEAQASKLSVMELEVGISDHKLLGEYSSSYRNH